MKSQTFSKILKIHNSYENGELNSIDQEIHEVNPKLDKNSKENYLYFFLSTSINFRRNSQRLWQSALATYQDKQTQYLFSPERVVNAKYSTFQKDMAKHSLAIQINKHPQIWHTLSETLYKHYNSNPKNIFKEAEFRVDKMINLLQQDKRDLFPYLRGPKLSNYMIMILSTYTDLEFEDIYNLSIVPDTHIIKSSHKLGLVSDSAKPKEVEEVWRPILKELNLDPRSMHSALWHWSRKGFPLIS